jgi:hypothetical protein
LGEFLKSANVSPSRYPKFGGLEVALSEKRLGLEFLSWRQIVDELVKQGLGTSSEK